MHAHEGSLAMLLVLGAVHGINPAMGWLFAVSLGLQEQRRGAVWAALAPLAAGHGLAIAAVLVIALALGTVIPLSVLKWITAAALLGSGAFQLMRHRHPRLGGMRVGARELTLWSFLMASAHGAGLMALPFTFGLIAPSEGHHAHHGVGDPAVQLAGQALSSAQAAGLLATVIHTAGYLLVAGLIAFIVYERIGLRLLRTAWINLNVIWAGALLITAVLTLLV